MEHTYLCSKCAKALGRLARLIRPPSTRLKRCHWCDKKLRDIYRVTKSRSVPIDEVIKLLERLGNDPWARIDARAWADYYRKRKGNENAPGRAKAGAPQ